MYYSAIGLLAILVLLIENQDILLNRNGAFALPAWRVYRRFLLAALAYYTTDVLWGVLETQKLSSLLYIDTSVYYVAMAAGVYFWGQYAVAYLEEKNLFGRFLVLCGHAIAVSVILLSIVNIFVPLLFTVDEHCVYHPLIFRYIMLVCQILLLFLITGYSLISLMRHQETAEKAKKYRTVTLFGLIMATLLLVQVWYPYLPLYTIAYLLGTCLLRTFVIGDEKETYRLELEEAAKITALRQSISSLLNNMPAMSFSKDAVTGEYLACNQAFADYARKSSPDGVVGLTDLDLFDEATAKQFAQDDRLALSMDAPYIFFEEATDAAGNQRQLQTTKLKYIDTDGRLCTLGMCQDVTDLVRIQRENATTKEAYERERQAGIIYSHIARTLVHGYADLFYVNLDTEEFIEYHTDDNLSTLSEARRGTDFFASCQVEAPIFLYPDDVHAFQKSMERQNLLDALDRNGTFLMTYRLLREDRPRYVSMKISRMEDDERIIVIGVADVDEQMQRQRAVEQIKDERIAYARLSALNGDFLSVYIIEPESENYRKYSAATGFDALSLPNQGSGFFDSARDQWRVAVHPDDLNRFLSLFNRESVMSTILEDGLFSMSCRLILKGKPFFVQFKAAMVEEKEGRRLIVGINNIDAQVRQEEDYERRLAKAQREANTDALTGVKNKHAYLNAEEQLNQRIRSQLHPEFAVVILDLNDLKHINDTLGHREGDEHLRRACRVICETFQHSPVFRVGGDEFAVITQGSDYQNVDALIEMIHRHNMESIRTGGVVVACGMARNENDSCVDAVFQRADIRMYENKNQLKELQHSSHVTC